MQEKVQPPKTTIPEAPELPPVFNKKTLFFYLFPHRATYCRRRLREYFFKREILGLLDIRPSDYAKIRTFSPQQCATIRRLIK